MEILLVSISNGQNDSQELSNGTIQCQGQSKSFDRELSCSIYLCEAEEESDAPRHSKSAVDGVLVLLQAWRADRAGGRQADFVHRVARRMVVCGGCVETAARESCLYVGLDVIGNFVPSFLGEDSLLLLRDCEARARNGELNDEQAEEDDHVEEQSDLMMLSGSIEPHQSQRDQDDATSYDGRNYGQVGESISVDCRTYKQPPDNLYKAKRFVT